MLSVIEDWNSYAEEENVIHKVSIFANGYCFNCNASDFLDYCQGCGPWKEGDTIGYNTGKELMMFDLDSIMAIKITTEDKVCR